MEKVQLTKIFDSKDLKIKEYDYVVVYLFNDIFGAHLVDSSPTPIEEFYFEDVSESEKSLVKIGVKFKYVEFRRITTSLVYHGFYLSFSN